MPAITLPIAAADFSARPISLRERAGAVDERHGARVELQGHAARRRHLAGVANQAEARDVGTRVDLAGW